MSLAVITFISIFLLVASGILLVSYRLTVSSRLSRLTGSGRTAEAPSLDDDSPYARSDKLAALFDPIQRLVPKSPKEITVSQRRLQLAGYRRNSHLAFLYTAKVVVPLSLAALATVMGLYGENAFFVYSLALALGFLAPDFWLGWKIRQRQFELRLALPEVLDLLTVCVEAGLGLDQALLRVADEMRSSRPEIAEELTLVNLEQRAGKTRTESLRNLGDRTDVESIREFVAMLIQTDQFGTSLASALRVHSASLRTQRRQEVEEIAAKTTVKLIFPLVFCIFPSLFVVALGPSFIKIIDAMKEVF